jgi:N6-adenosine-specific RNA methylase IME4
MLHRSLRLKRFVVRGMRTVPLYHRFACPIHQLQEEGSLLYKWSKSACLVVPQGGLEYCCTRLSGACL